MVGVLMREQLSGLIIAVLWRKRKKRHIPRR